ncbi:HNH endonuclease [Salinadaptatus halalkaliphilus]|uniref:HNH endonuclease n=1 Tax=Salinadaptatus halalkaliphilus TaxID=2419781 RepID=UPI001FE47AE9|nr:HNH endonuclease signature motif containing protein [Salinadaptatus halalkaliphilus]
MTDDGMTAETYATTIHARVVNPELSATVILRHNRECPISSVDQPGLLDVAHVLSWSDYPEHRADLANVLPLSKTHHAAFDRELFTIDQDYRLHVNPGFETQSELLQRTIIHQDGEQVVLPDESLNPEYLAQHNASLAWV